jgi:hypothetical protein
MSKPAHFIRGSLINSMTDCLANTGSADVFPYIGFALLLLVGGAAIVAVARKRSRLAALALMPLLIGVIFFSGGASDAQAAQAGNDCGTPMTQGETVVVPPVSTPAPEPVCTPISYDSIAPEAGDWSETTSPVEGIEGLVQSWDEADSRAVETLVAATSMYPLPGIVTLTIVENPTEPDAAVVEHTVSVVRGVSPDEYVEWITLSTSEHTVFIPQAVIDTAVAEQLPDLDDSWSLSAVGIVVNSNYLDGCGGVKQATITLGGAVPQV